MSKPHFIVEYLGAITAEANKDYTTAQVISQFPTATMMKLKTEGVSVNINGTDLFPVSYDDESYITTGKTYIFNKKCTIVVGRYVVVT